MPELIARGEEGVDEEDGAEEGTMLENVKVTSRTTHKSLHLRSEGGNISASKQGDLLALPVLREEPRWCASLWPWLTHNDLFK